jgi:phosphoglycolate phosphatase
MELEPSISPLPFAWGSFDAYLFDIDGTLLNSRDGVHYNSFHSALRQVWNCELKIDGIPLHGNTDIGILRAAASAVGVSAEAFSRGLPQAIATMQADV